MRRLRWFALLVAIVAPVTLEGQFQPVQVNKQQFQQLRWIAGKWRGSGGSYPAFFEEYQVLNDSTIRMRSFSDSTLRVVSDSSTIEFRGGTIRSRNKDGSFYNAVEVSATSIRFLRPGAVRGGHTFESVSADHWIATLHPAQPRGQATIYTMRRLTR